MTYVLSAGLLDRRVDIQRRDLVPHPDTNELIESYVSYATGVPCRVVRSPGSEFLSMNQVVSEQRAVFTIRWRAGVIATDRVVYEGKSWDIVDIRELGRRVGLEIHARLVT